MTTVAVDISNNNHGTDIAALEADLAASQYQLAAVIIKVTEGSTFADPDAPGFIAQCQALGIPWVAYHCIWNLDTVPAQVAWFLKHADGAAALMLDWEKFGPATAPIATTSRVLQFMALADNDPCPRFMYAANWIFGYPGVTRDERLVRWPLITPDGTPCAPWTSMVLQQNPQGYWKGLDIDLPISGGNFFTAIDPHTHQIQPAPLRPQEAPTMRVFDTDGTITLVIGDRMRWLPLPTDEEQWLAATGQASPAPLQPWMWSDFYWTGPAPTYPDNYAHTFRADPAKLCKPDPGSTSHLTGTIHIPSVPGDATITINAA